MMHTILALILKMVRIFFLFIASANLPGNFQVGLRILILELGWDNWAILKYLVGTKCSIAFSPAFVQIFEINSV